MPKPTLNEQGHVKAAIMRAHKRYKKALDAWTNIVNEFEHNNKQWIEKKVRAFGRPLVAGTTAFHVGIPEENLWLTGAEIRGHAENAAGKKPELLTFILEEAGITKD